ncbi:hypothetical protein HJFPF1_02165 [Paramyrothecium foliicola]|nr:hypothetical protein HJFPF1_02165 [Paramyrothecium foliicola]
MIATKFLLMAMAACVKATPVATAPDAETTDWTALPIPKDFVDFEGIDLDAFNNPANWKPSSSEGLEVIEDFTLNPTQDVISLMSGACSQGNCPDYNAAFDLVFTFVAVPVMGDPDSPPLTLFEGSSDIRANDCKKCSRKKVGSSLGNSVVGGCYDFTGCGRKRSIYIDPGILVNIVPIAFGRTRDTRNVTK